MPEPSNPNPRTPSLQIIDTHAHLYHKRFDSDRDAMIERAKAAGVETIVMPAIDVASIQAAIDLCERHSGLYAMTALHPSDVKEATDEDFGEVARFCDDPHVVAVGESGLDYYWDRSFDEKQQDYFRRHIHLAIEKDLPLILHMRDKQGKEEVHREIVRILEEERLVTGTPERMRGIFHCFGGPAWMVEAAETLGFLLGIGGTLTFKNSGVADIVKDIPLSRIVLETDAPFLAPEPYRGKRNESAYTSHVAEKLAVVKGVSLEEVAEITSANARQLFGI